MSIEDDLILSWASFTVRSPISGSLSSEKHWFMYVEQCLHNWICENVNVVSLRATWIKNEHPKIVKNVNCWTWISKNWTSLGTTAKPPRFICGRDIVLIHVNNAHYNITRLERYCFTIYFVMLRIFKVGKRYVFIVCWIHIKQILNTKEPIISLWLSKSKLESLIVSCYFFFSFLKYLIVYLGPPTIYQYLKLQFDVCFDQKSVGYYPMISLKQSCRLYWFVSRLDFDQNQ